MLGPKWSLLMNHQTFVTIKTVFVLVKCTLSLNFVKYCDFSALTRAAVDWHLWEPLHQPTILHVIISDCLQCIKPSPPASCLTGFCPSPSKHTTPHRHTGSCTHPHTWCACHLRLGEVAVTGTPSPMASHSGSGHRLRHTVFQGPGWQTLSPLLLQIDHHNIRREIGGPENTCHCIHSWQAKTGQNALPNSKNTRVVGEFFSLHCNLKKWATNPPPPI